MNKTFIFPERFQILHKSLQCYFNRNLKNSEITAAHVHYILLLSQESMTQSEMTKCYKADKAHTNRVASHLLEKGYIQYEESNSVKNKKLELTQKGKDFADQCKKMFKEYIKSLTFGIDKKELEQTEKVLNKLVENAILLKEKSEDYND